MFPGCQLAENSGMLSLETSPLRIPHMHKGYVAKMFATFGRRMCPVQGTVIYAILSTVILFEIHILKVNREFTTFAYYREPCSSGVVRNCMILIHN